MRILMTADTIGGVWVYAKALASALIPEQVDIALATMGRPLTDEQRRSLQQLPNVTLFESAYRLEWMENCWGHVDAAGHWLLKISDEYQPDLVHLNNFCHSLLPWNVPRLLVAHSDVFSWFRAVKRCPPGDIWSKYYAEVRTGLHAVEHVVVPSYSAKHDLEREYGEIPQLTVIPNGIPLSVKDPPQTKTITYFTAGRAWDEAKNIYCLEQCARELDSPIYVAGAQENNYMEHWWEDWSTKSPLQFLGELPHSRLMSCLAQTQIYLAPALYEPFGLGILEAAAARCALVLSDIPSLRENWDEAALFCDPQQPEVWRKTLRKLANEGDARQELAARARARSAAFSARRMARSYLSLYRELLHGGKHGTHGGVRDERRTISPLPRF